MTCEHGNPSWGCATCIRTKSRSLTPEESAVLAKNLDAFYEPVGCNHDEELLRLRRLEKKIAKLTADLKKAVREVAAYSNPTDRDFGYVEGYNSALDEVIGLLDEVGVSDGES